MAWERIKAGVTTTDNKQAKAGIEAALKSKRNVKVNRKPERKGHG
jgi:hypothetical protein